MRLAHRIGLALSPALLLFAGCGVCRHHLDNPGVDQVLAAESGDRYSFELDEDESGRAWFYACDDPDVEVTIDRSTTFTAAGGFVGGHGKVVVTIRFHRGFDGPTDVEFTCRRRGEKPEQAARRFALTFYLRGRNAAFWE